MTRLVAALVAVLFALPAASAAAPAPSLFGLNTGTYDPSYSRFVRDLPAARSLGARWVHFYGTNVKYTRAGRVTFAQLDHQVDGARRLGLGVMLTFGGVRGACSVRPRAADPSSCPPRTASELRTYAAFVRREVRRYRGRVRYWESWPEPNHQSFWPSGPDPAEYAALLRVQYRALKQADPRAQLILSGMGGTDLPFLDGVLRALRGARAFDLAGAHPYRFPPAAPDVSQPIALPSGGSHAMTWKEELQATEDAYSARGYGRPRLWLTEFGWPGSRSGGGPYHLTYAQQAQSLKRAYALLQHDPELRFVQAAFWFNLRDYAPGFQNPDPEFFGHYGLLENGFARKPAASLFARLARR
jgi:hypothetical protein